MGNFFANAVMAGWIPAILLLFPTVTPRRRGVIGAFLLATLFLPMMQIKLAAGVPVFDKTSATCLGILLAMFLFDIDTLLRFRPSLCDLPMVVWCLCPMASSLSNDLGVHDGAAEAFRQTVTWGLPYLIGRIYFRNAEELRELAIGIFAGGLLYVPFCLWEMRVSPQLHLTVYGFMQHSFRQTIRFGGYRPMVFMQHGLMVGLWMCMAALVGLRLWVSHSVRQLPGIHIGWPTLLLLATAILCKSTGAIVLLMLGAAALSAPRWMNRSLPIYCLAAVAPLYIALRASCELSGEWLASASTQVVGADRSQSLAFRFDNENQLIAKAMQQPLFGWGGWGRSRIYDQYGNDKSITDGEWIIAIGTNGILGVSALYLALLLPVIIVVARGATSLSANEKDFAPVLALAMVVLLYGIDCLMNAMLNPMYCLAAGGLATLSASVRVQGALPASSVPARNSHSVYAEA
jgi:hypothetical protein